MMRYEKYLSVGMYCLSQCASRFKNVEGKTGSEAAIAGGKRGKRKRKRGQLTHPHAKGRLVQFMLNVGHRVERKHREDSKKITKLCRRAEEKEQTWREEAEQRPAEPQQHNKHNCRLRFHIEINSKLAM